MRTERLLISSFALLGSLVAALCAHAEWTIDEALGRGRVSLEIQHRTRYEFLDDPFRPANAGKSATDVVVQRTLLHARVRATQGLTIGAELMDSRAIAIATPSSTRRS